MTFLEYLEKRRETDVLDAHFAPQLRPLLSRVLRMNLSTIEQQWDELIKLAKETADGPK